MKFVVKSLVTAVAAASVLSVSLPAHALVTKNQRMVEHSVRARAADAMLEFQPSGKGFALARHAFATQRRHRRPSGGANGINYNGGPIMSGNTNVYYIWYGDWSSYGTTQSVLTTFMNGLGGTPLFNVNTTYYDNTGAYVANSVTLAGQVSDNYSQGSTIDDNGVLAIVQNAINNGSLPLDPNASYMVLTSPDVNESSGFGSQYCGWHNSANVNGTDVKYAFIGDPIQIAPQGCGVNNPSPNNDGGADAMASVMFHELSESVSDPDITAWYDSQGNENGDKCAWNFGTTYTTSNGATANQNFGGADWLLQQMWLNANGGMCVQSY